jgi:muconate cycloisomerase
MRRYRISAVEQPVAKDDYPGLKTVKDAVDVPIIADESLRSVENARQLADGRMVDMFNVRISKCGGMLAAREIARIAEAAGLMCQLGPHPGEGPLLTAAGRHVAGATPNLRYCEADIFDILRKQDISRQSLRPRRGGVAPLLPGPGLGVEIDERKLEAYVVERHCLV